MNANFPIVVIDTETELKVFEETTNRFPIPRKDDWIKFKDDNGKVRKLSVISVCIDSIINNIVVRAIEY